ncbi:MAG TPA: ATP-dependent protease, partial [Aminobacteriaceae bacterium]|nr:ATP-dependent protease [Aminobacteriaceae bacterium]
DSASSTELYCLLSALSEVPLKQGIAVTGSVDQFGNIQPIGGVNEKIEGFFEYCEHGGLTGEQGVLIPVQNTRHLMLDDTVIEAVSKGKFFIRAVSTIDEGIEALTGVSAESIHRKVKNKLKKWAKKTEKLKKGKDSEAGGDDDSEEE